MPTFSNIQQHKIRIKQLMLTDFRGFGSLPINFGESEKTIVLIADNGSGKTSVLDAIAEFLRYFLSEGILLGTSHQTQLTRNDIFNDRLVANGKTVLELSYPYPHVSVFQLILELVELLNENQVAGIQARLDIEKTAPEHFEWLLRITGGANQQDDFDFLLPLETLDKLDVLVQDKILTGEDCFLIAENFGEIWTPNLNLNALELKQPSTYTGTIGLEFELNQSGCKFLRSVEKNDSNPKKFIEDLSINLASLSDFKKSTSLYDPNKESTKENPLTLPLLAYYGGSAIHTKSEKIAILYEPQSYQAYVDAMNPDRFNFKDFFEWFHYLQEEPDHIKSSVVRGILSMLNEDDEDAKAIYTNLRIEKGYLKLDKKSEAQGEPISIEIGQLSAGEKNLFAIAGDLIKRSILLNPVLFEVDFDPQSGSYSNPFFYTEGIVLIDEIDLHLHPKWQRMVVPKLRKLFPNVQFIVTTHSPFVLQSVEHASIMSLPKLNEWDGLSGWEIYEIIQDVMATSGETMSQWYQDLAGKFNQAILYDDQDELEKSFEWLKKHLNPKNPKKAAYEIQYQVFSKIKTKKND